MKIYTKSGDKGMTSLVGGKRVRKTDCRLEAYGTVDELNSNLGLLMSFMSEGDDWNFLRKVQNNLFVVGAYLATDTDNTSLTSSSIMKQSEVEAMEREIDRMTSEVPEHRSFILPGGCNGAALAHVCRTVCRRAERRIFLLADEVEIDEIIMSYMNRLSDYLFILARKLNFIEHFDENTWQKTCE